MPYSWILKKKRYIKKKNSDNRKQLSKKVWAFSTSKSVLLLLYTLLLTKGWNEKIFTGSIFTLGWFWKRLVWIFNPLLIFQVFLISPSSFKSLTGRQLRHMHTREPYECRWTSQEVSKTFTLWIYVSCKTLRQLMNSWWIKRISTAIMT